TLLHLVTGRRPAEVAPAAGLDAGPPLPAALRGVITAGLEADEARRPDLATFLARVREARWATLVERVLGAGAAPGPGRLHVAVSVATTEDPDTFHPPGPDGAWPVPLAAGDFIKVEAAANADGYHTVLILSSSGETHVVLPRPTAPTNHF